MARRRSSQSHFGEDAPNGSPDPADPPDPADQVSSPAGSNHSGVPAAASEAVRLAMRKGLVLVLSLWGGGDMSWLDGGCRGAYQQCQLGSAQAVVSNLRVENASRKGGAVLVEGR